MLAHSPLGFSDTEGQPAVSPKIGADAEDDVPKSTIPVVVREAVCISLSIWCQYKY